MRVLGVIFLDFFWRRFRQRAGQLLDVGARQHLTARGFYLRHNIGPAVYLQLGGLVYRHLLVDQLLQHFAAHRLCLLGCGVGGIGARQKLVDLVYRYFFGAHLGGDLGGDFCVVFLAAGGEDQRERSDCGNGEQTGFQRCVHGGYGCEVRGSVSKLGADAYHAGVVEPCNIGRTAGILKRRVERQVTKRLPVDGNAGVPGSVAPLCDKYTG